MTINNIQHFLLHHEADIVSIPGLASRLDDLEREVAALSMYDTQSDRADEFEVEGCYADSFDQGDHDELFADGGATERSVDLKDHDELFGDDGEDGWETDGGASGLGELGELV